MKRWIIPSALLAALLLAACNDPDKQPRKVDDAQFDPAAHAPPTRLTTREPDSNLLRDQRRIAQQFSERTDTAAPAATAPAEQPADEAGPAGKSDLAPGGLDAPGAVEPAEPAEPAPRGPGMEEEDGGLSLPEL